MKKIILAAALAISVAFGAFAQSDLTTLVVVKLTKSETITLKQLKNRVELYQKQNGAASFTVEQKKDILNALVDEKLILQAAQKAGLSIPDSQIDQHFAQGLSQQVGRPVTEADFAAYIKKNTGLEFDDFMRQQIGMSVPEYKAYLKNQLIAQQYVMQQKKDDIAKAAPSDEEIRAYFEMNKATFAQNDMVKLFLVVVPKGNDAAAAKAKAEKLLGQLKDKSVTYDTLKANSKNDASYQGGEMFVSKTAVHAKQLGISYNDLLELFTYDIGYLSQLNETPADFQFYSVRGKYPAKLLALSDVVQPETTVTVYDYIKGYLTQQKQSQALLKAIEDITKSLDTPSNVERKKTGADLDKLLNW